MKKDDIAVFSTEKFKIDFDDNKPYCLQFYTLLFGDAFGDLEMIAKYYDDTGEFKEEVSLGKIEHNGPPIDKWLPFQYNINNKLGQYLSLTFKARRGPSPQDRF